MFRAQQIAHDSTGSDQALPAELLATPGPDEWSANDVLAHLRACSDVWGGHIAAILQKHQHA
jgi:hypothetical protein